ncbi:hypothetical protein DYB26_007574 [Aphanomyces astaci]|uniref:C2H2-type domain-containing protein n=3 Tax=Aphanomyces astaci TaxID=112090 RepID=A0A397APC6_APHAT|nr:hypothetical protein DYB36_003051 [Aphanomyces astaci]RHZ21355.1 hypothetical protein DYB26_007574 [Aphanomyces astaci]
MSIPVRDEGGSSSAEHAVDKFVCDICAQTFRFKGNLKRHQITAHVGLKPFQCEHCPKSFARKADMQVHMRVHTGEKPYPCEECGKQFARISDLRSHERTHRGEKRFACPFPMCDKQYTRRVDLKKHEMTHCASHPTASKRPLQPREATFPCPGDLASHAAHGRGCGHLSIEHGNHLDFIVNNQLVCLQGVKSLSVAPTRRILPGSAPQPHGPGCGHLAVRHNDHVDYVVDNSIMCHHGGVLADVDSLKLLDDDFWDFFGAMDSLTTQDEMSSGTEL